jgi:hypothetical protein
MSDFRSFHRAILELERVIRVLKQEDSVLLSGTVTDLQGTINHLKFLRDNFCKE